VNSFRVKFVISECCCLVALVSASEPTIISAESQEDVISHQHRLCWLSWKSVQLRPKGFIIEGEIIHGGSIVNKMLVRIEEAPANQSLGLRDPASRPRHSQSVEIW
jgi:hypothetical protein